MARYQIDTWPEEQSTVGISVSFLDDEGAASTPLSVSWRLTTDRGVEIATGTETPAETVLIVLSGAALSYTASQGAKRELVVTGTYDSATLGDGVPYVHVIEFQVVPVAGWPAA